MNITHIALVGFVASTAWVAWPRQPTIIDTHGATRKFVIRSTVERVSDPIIVLGDSIVEGSTLPRTLCGRPVVNAGIGGLSTTTALRANLGDALQNTRAALIVVSLGSNDAGISNGVEAYRENYKTLFAELRKFSDKIALVQVPPLEAGLPEGQNRNATLIADYNAALPVIAASVSATLIELPAMPARHTFDGVHLNAAGYRVWEKAVVDGIEGILCKSKDAQAGRRDGA